MKWQLTAARKAAMQTQLKEIEKLLNQEPPPSFKKLLAAVEKLHIEFDTNRHQGKA